MGEIGDRLEQHLHGLAGPYLFVGSGVARRYAGLEDWEGLLRRFAQLTGTDYGYFRSLAGPGEDRLPTVASHIADAFLPVWWREDEYSASRDLWKDKVDGAAYVLKVEIARYLSEKVATSVVPADVEDEFKLFQDVVVEGVITTNYDPLLDSVVFPDFKVFVGQDELLFADTHGIAETYKIHGSVERPESLVLTAEDYEDFNDRYAYLAAKLLTIFVEHPVVFLGYSLADGNIRAILQSIVRGLRGRNVEQLRDRLIFVEWDKTAIPSMTETIHVIDGASVPILRLVVPDFVEVFTALGRRERALPARVLRLLKEQVFEIVRDNDPSGRLVAVSDMDDPNASSLDVVFGVGAKITRLGLVGLSRFDIVDDVLRSPDRELPAGPMIESVIAKIPLTTYVPVFKYLRAAGHLDDDGNVLASADVPQSIRRRAAALKVRMEAVAPAATMLSVAQLEKSWGWEAVFNSAMKIHSYTDDLDGLREFLIQHKAVRRRNWYFTQYAKLAVAYDWLQYGPGDGE